MKKCPVCGTGKARRLCARHGGVEVCSVCCAGIRDAECGDCVHYGAAQQHQAARSIRAPRKIAELAEGQFIIELNPELEEAVNRALDLAQLGQTEQARKTLTRLAREHPQNHYICFGMGVLHAFKKELEQAIDWFDQATAIYPYMIEAHFNKAVAYQELFDVPNCIRAFRKVVELGDLDDPEVAKARSILDRIEASLRAQEGIGLDTFLATSGLFEQAFDCLQRGEFQQAVDGFQKVIVMNERNATSHGNLGLCYACLGFKAKALAELDRALELNPGYQPARINRRVVVTMREGQPLDPKTFNTIDSKDWERETDGR